MKMPSLIPIERSKMSNEMWEKLKVHIIRQREKRKQEQEQDAEQERLRREQELKRKKDAMTLEEIKDQLNKLETKLKDMRKEKTDLFSQLKKVLNEGPSVRKKPREREPEVTGPQLLNNHVYPYYISTSMMSAASVANCQPPMYHRNPNLNVPMTSMVSNNVNNNFISPQSATNHTQVVPVSVHSVPGVMSQSANQGLKRPLQRSYEKSPSPPGVPYTGILPVYKNPMSYTPALPRTQGNYLYYPQGAPSQLDYEIKGSPYHIFPRAPGPFGDNLRQIDAAEYEASKLRYDYQQQMRVQSLVGPPHPSTSSLIPIQTGPSKPGGISAGFPVQRVSDSNSGPNAGPRDVRDSVSVLYPGRDVREPPPVPFHGRDMRDPYPGRDMRDSSVPPYPLYY